MEAYGYVTYQQILGSLLRGSVCKGRSGIWECLWELCGANLEFLSGLCGPARLSPSLHPTSETKQKRNSRILVYQHS